MGERARHSSPKALTKAILGQRLRQPVWGFRSTTDGTVDFVSAAGSVVTGFAVLAGEENDFQVAEVTASTAGDIWLYGDQPGGTYGAYALSGTDSNSVASMVPTPSGVFAASSYGA